MPGEFAQADIVILPATVGYKSPNRAIEAVRQGCFVVAEPHPSLEGFPGIWVGDIKEGIEWARQNPKSANELTLKAQAWTENFAPALVASAWSRLIRELSCTLGAGASSGPATPTSTLRPETSDATSGIFPSRTDVLT